ncbi:hypothetical protein CHS0354_027042 [Potamilus streckersoni]|uniref:Uncharacterized protein n=1 Tax=Potamilus streckersoni TaxID=2493646 RepID=A0AAE0RMR3_9BIVA|nr:hypothetical protein CHS0354_027042 [Potamilus streckersoni]
MSEVPSLIGKRYVLLDEANTKIENIVENYDKVNVRETNLEEELNHFTGERKQNHFLPLHITVPETLTDLQDKRTHEKTRQPMQQYYVKVAVLIDFGVWQL